MKNNNKKNRKGDISKELMFVAQRPTRWWNCCLAEDEKKGIEPVFTDKSQYKSVR